MDPVKNFPPDNPCPGCFLSYFGVSGVAGYLFAQYPYQKRDWYQWGKI
jgi:hypothetical protein